MVVNYGEKITLKMKLLFSIITIFNNFAIKIVNGKNIEEGKQVKIYKQGLKKALIKYQNVKL